MNILMVYPTYPDTFWSFKHALKFVSKGASFPPLGLLTVASILPGEWNKKLIDMNVSNLSDQDILWADYVYISAMSVQSESVNFVIEKCKKLKTKIVAGGPLFTSNPDFYKQIDHLVLNEAEITLPRFLIDLSKGEPKQKYNSEEWADITATPLPLWELIDINNYSSMNLQYSRGCPYDCDFCDITVLYGRFTLLDRMNHEIANKFVYQMREEPGVQPPALTLKSNSGSCRDFAALFMEACRHLGLASRFVSGYVYSAAIEAGNASTHAWSEVYLPGAGWKGFDPTSGVVAGNRHIAAAVARHPEDVPPVAGSYLGAPGQRPLLRVAVRVSALT
ncbi:MAG: transglutaminase domain-containing protein [Ignavibacteriaceae bacterium]